MHDPMTVAFEIYYPWHKRFWQTDRQYLKEKNTKFHTPFITIWHNDPEKDGTDDSCGWFMRSRHGDKKLLEKIVKRFEFDWDRTFTSNSSGIQYACGLFFLNGMPHLSVVGIVLNLFFQAAMEIFGSREKAVKYIQSNLFEILFFAENPVDSIVNSITLKFGNDERREDRIKNMASIIYGYILRDIRPWYKHPRWHVWHWSFQIHPLQGIKRYLFDRCAICKRGFKWGESVIGNWDGDKIWHEVCDKQLQCEPKRNK